MPQTARSQVAAGPMRLGDARVWALVDGEGASGKRIAALVKELGVKPRTFKLDYESWQPYLGFLGMTTRLGLKRDARGPLVPPWPDLVISDSPASEPVAKWIRARALELGTRVRLVYLNRPWGDIENFDLVVVTPQHHVAPTANVRLNRLLLRRFAESELELAYKAHLDMFRSLPKPHFVLLIGGQDGAGDLSEQELRSLLRMANDMTQDAGGSLCIIADANAGTRQDARHIIEEEIKVRKHLHYQRSPNATQSGGDASDDIYLPYLAMLAHGDAFILAGDSSAILAEVLGTGKPVYLHHRIDRSARFSHYWDRLLSYRWSMLSSSGAHWRRSLADIHRQLVTEGRTVWLGERFKPHDLEPIDDLSQTAAAVRNLFT